MIQAPPLVLDQLGTATLTALEAPRFLEMSTTMALITLAEDDATPA